MNIKEAAEQLTSAGITTTDTEVMRWIEEGKIKADIYQTRKITYKISMKDLTDFILRQKTANLVTKLDEANRENQKLNEEIQLFKTRLHIEQSKVRTLKKLLNTQIEETAPSTIGDLLGLSQNQNSQILKKEFKKLLKALHPDRGGDERLFKVFNEHYENLK
ncbi:J domain-containing protein [Bacillus sp. C11]|nr:J domain-containing protein [Neobacillus terrae]